MAPSGKSRSRLYLFRLFLLPKRQILYQIYIHIYIDFLAVCFCRSSLLSLHSHRLLLTVSLLSSLILSLFFLFFRYSFGFSCLRNLNLSTSFSYFYFARSAHSSVLLYFLFSATWFCFGLSSCRDALVLR